MVSAKELNKISKMIILNRRVVTMDRKNRKQKIDIIAYILGRGITDEF